MMMMLRLRLMMLMRMKVGGRTRWRRSGKVDPRWLSKNWRLVG
jgi:hypothetical protein